jgi:hypothetical protein
MRLNFSPSPARPRYGLRSQRGEASGRCQALGVPAYGVGHIARAEPGPGATQQPRAGQEVEPHPLAPHIDERPTWPGWAARAWRAGAMSISWRA